MEFFNKKEDVINLGLTQFGRNLLSRGKFKPVYYSFFDDNILYDSLKAGFLEEQNDSEQRIKGCQTMQPQIAFSSLEKEFNTNYEMILSSQTQADPVILQKTADKNYALPQPLGTSDINSEYAPSWTIRYLQGSISGSSDNLSLQEKTGGRNVVHIPQLLTDVEVKVKVLPDHDGPVDESPGTPSQSDIIVQNEDEYYVLLKVMENNALYQKKNFDIEFFEIIEQQEGDVTIEVLRPLHFPKSRDLKDPHETYDDVTPTSDQNYVAHYFELRVDDEIDSTILCSFDPVNQKLGVFADERTTICQDILNQQQKTSFNIYEGGTEDIPGDIC